jgi:hypothetical protein
VLLFLIKFCLHTSVAAFKRDTTWNDVIIHNMNKTEVLQWLFLSYFCVLSSCYAYISHTNMNATDKLYKRYLKILTFSSESNSSVDDITWWPDTVCGRPWNDKDMLINFHRINFNFLLLTRRLEISLGDWSDATVPKMVG